MAQEASTARQQFEQQQKSSEVRLWAAEGEMEKLREDKIKLSVQVKRLSRRLGKSKREMTVALLALQRYGVVEDSSVLAAENTQEWNTYRNFDQRDGRTDCSWCNLETHMRQTVAVKSTIEFEPLRAKG